MERRNKTLLLHASAARTATLAGHDPVAIAPFSPSSIAEFELDVTAAATAVGDTLDVFVQVNLDGTNWIDVVHFTQVLGNGGAKRFVAKIVGNLAEAMFSTATTLAAGSVRHILGPQFRVRWDIVGTGSFTFSVTGHFYGG